MKRNSQKDIVAYVMGLHDSSVVSLKSYAKREKRTIRVMLIWDKKYPLPEKVEKNKNYDILLQIDFSKPEKISEALKPYENEFMAISCRSEANISRFAKVIPNVPYLRTPTTESLMWASDKYEMRKRFKAYNPKITPIFTRVLENTKAERDRVISRVGFPMIIKPTNLAASLFVTICYHEEDLQKALGVGFRKLRKAYENDKRIEEPKMIAEQYMEGDMYSIDSYVNSRGVVYHCPLVRVKTGKEIGRNDFYGYLQMTPTVLKRETIEKAQSVAEDAVHALALRSTTVHIELMKVDNDWKVIEVGARMGGARDKLYALSCDIDHPLNDILVRVPKNPVVPKKCKGFSAYMKWFAEKEGTITEMKGIKKIESVASFYEIKVNKKVGDRSIFARNGGRCIFELYLYNSDRSALLADIRRVEQLVKIKVK